ncbi:MAG TPA: OB-fold nucleic acid binding domain-containing protein [Deltaproteobacteria bacterium]|nr:OB-fold nucleic acid binding domain-containing protein [Deltaproteobacteria bacterium]
MIPKGKFVTEISDGDRIKAVFLLSDRRLLTARNGKPYGRVVLSDKTGEITGLVWDDAPEQMSGVAPGDVVGVRALAETYDKKLQLRIEKITRIPDRDVDMAALVPASRHDPQTLAREFDEAVASIRNPFLRDLVGRVFMREGVRESFLRAPAAKGIHHNYLGGLVEHTLSILKAVDALLGVYAHMNLNRDMLVAGAILHDLGKIYEYTCDRIIEITPVGRLLGHIYLSAHMVDQEAQAIDGFPEELKLQLLHMILGHHGQLEFGSPKLPMTREAVFLHMVDDLDAKLTGITSIIEATPEDEPFSAYSSVYNRHLYTRTYRWEEDDEE